MGSRLYKKYFGRPLRLYWWRHAYPHKPNFGDELTPLVIERLFGRRCTWSPPAKCELAGAGSIIELLQDHSNGNEIEVWGSGFIRQGPENACPNLHFAAVRGCVSLDRISNSDVALGDPGLLLPRVFDRSQAEKRYSVGVIPHYADHDNPGLQPARGREDYKVINVLDPVEQVVDDITSCEFIVSSSLHGLVVSDAYGIPNCWMPFSRKLIGGAYKFRDYYSVFDEKPRPVPTRYLYNRARLDELATAYIPREGMSSVQDKLMKAFPS